LSNKFGRRRGETRAVEEEKSEEKRWGKGGSVNPVHVRLERRGVGGGEPVNDGTRASALIKRRMGEGKKDNKRGEHRGDEVAGEKMELQCVQRKTSTPSGEGKGKKKRKRKQQAVGDSL